MLTSVFLVVLVPLDAVVAWFIELMSVLIWYPFKTLNCHQPSRIFTPQGVTKESPVDG